MMTSSSELSPISLWALNTHGNTLSSGKVSRLRTYAASDRVSFLCLQECGTPSPPFPNCFHSPLGSGLAILHWGYYPQRTVWSTPFALFILFSSSPLPNPPPHTLLVVGTVYLSCIDATRCTQLSELDTWLHDTHSGELKSPPLYFGGDFNCPLSSLDSENGLPPTPHIAAPLTVSLRRSPNGAYATPFDTCTPQNAHTHTTKTTHTLSSPSTRRAVSTAGTPLPHPSRREC